MIADIKDTLARPHSNIPKADIVHMFYRSCIADAINLTGLLLHNDRGQLDLVLPSRSLSVLNNLAAAAAAAESTVRHHQPLHTLAFASCLRNCCWFTGRLSTGWQQQQQAERRDHICATLVAAASAQSNSCVCCGMLFHVSLTSTDITHSGLCVT